MKIQWLFNKKTILTKSQKFLVIIILKKENYSFKMEERSNLENSSPKISINSLKKKLFWFNWKLLRMRKRKSPIYGINQNKIIFLCKFTFIRQIKILKIESWFKNSITWLLLGFLTKKLSISRHQIRFFTNQ